MSADTLTADGAAVSIGPPAPDEKGNPSAFLGYAAVPGMDEIVTITESQSNGQGAVITATGYGLSGNLMFRDVLFDSYTVSGPPVVPGSPTLALLGDGNVAVAWNEVFYSSVAGAADNYYTVLHPTANGVTVLADGPVPWTNDNRPIEGAPFVYATSTGFTMAWNAWTSQINGPNQQFSYETQPFDDNGAATGSRTVTQTQGYGQSPPVAPTAFSALGSTNVQVTDNHLVYSSPTQSQSLAIPGEPAHAITDEAAALLTGGTQAVVGWVDSGTDYVSIYDAGTNSFGATIGLDWGGASDLHVLALPDGGFAVSWMNGGAYKGEVFDAGGAGGGIISLAGDVAGIASNGDLYTVALNSSGQYVVQEYAINGSGGSTGGGSTGGQTYTSDNNGDHWVGTSGDDTFHLGRGGDVVTGNGGNDTYLFAEVPWAGGHITDFNAGDVLDLTRLMSTTQDTGADGFADGYLKINDSTAGAQVWAQYATSGSSSGWWLVETLDGVSASSLTTSGDVVSMGGSAPPPQTSVSTSDSNYVAPSSVTSITLTGSQQHIDASATTNVTITSNNTGNTLIGGAGGDTFHLGRGGDVVTGGAGADVFAYAETPWGGGTITDFNGAEGDTVDVSGLLAKSGYTGSDPFADGYLKYTSDSSGNAQLWSDLHQAGNDGWWLVTTLDGVSTSSLHYSGGLIT